VSPRPPRDEHPVAGRGRISGVRLSLSIALFAAAVGIGVGARPSHHADPRAHEAGRRLIDEDDARTHLFRLAAPGLQGRDTPSLGQDRAEEYIARRFAEAGLRPWNELTGAPANGAASAADESENEAWTRYLWGFERQFEVPDERSLVELEVDGEPVESFVLGRDFHPLLEFGGEAEGELAFCGFGIDSKKERFDELAGVELRRTIAVVVEGEPRHRRKFEGPDVVTPEAALFAKLGDLQHEGVEGVVLVRRPPAEPERRPPVDVEPFETGGFGFRYGFAFWTEDNDELPRKKERLPVVEMTAEAAGRLVGFDVLEQAEAIERRLRPRTERLSDRSVRLVSATRWDAVEIHDVCGFVRGTDPAVRDECVVVGAHHDHVGMDSRGRIGLGADDNASGVSASIEIAEALAASPPRRSVVLVTFNAEEDGLLGSQAFVEDGPIAAERIACMINLDMIGRGSPREVAVLGIPENPDLEDVVQRAKRLSRTGLREIDLVRSDRGLFKRSDHFSFHEAGVPSLFLFEGMPIEANEDYHTWRDVPARVDCGKIASVAELAYNLAWLVATDEDRPRPPKRR